MVKIANMKPKTMPSALTSRNARRPVNRFMRFSILSGPGKAGKKDCSRVNLYYISTSCTVILLA